MAKIDELQQQVAAIEAQVVPGMTKDEMYDLLVVAYNALKDIIVLQQGNLPVDKDTALEDTLRDSQEQVRVLEAWKDGANLEGELLRDKVASLTKELTTTTVLADGRGRQLSAILEIIN